MQQKNIETAILSLSDSPIPWILRQLQEVVQLRTAPFFIDHIRAHMSLPGPLSEGNALADHNSRFQLICPTLEQAKLFHSKWHVNSNTLRYRFHITKE